MATLSKKRKRSTSKAATQPEPLGLKLIKPIEALKLIEPKPDASKVPPQLQTELRDVARRFAESYWSEKDRSDNSRLEIVISEDDGTGILSVFIDDLRLPATSAAESNPFIDALHRFVAENFTAEQRRQYPDVYVTLGSPVRAIDAEAPAFNSVYRLIVRSPGSFANDDGNVPPRSTVKTEAAEHPDLTVDDMGVLVALIEQSLKGHVAPNNPTRFTISSLLAPRDGNGDSQPEDLETCREILRLFAELPVDDRKRILNGWNPEILNLSRRELRKWFDDMPITPALWVEGRCDDDKPTFSSWAMDGQGTETIDVFIRAGVTKAEVMKALDQVTHFIDFNWDRMIAEPDKAIREN